MDKKYLIINADDFGLSSSVNKGILETHLAGNVTSTSIMVNMPGFKDAVNIAYKTPSLKIGLHFNLTYGKPVNKPIKVPSLVDNYGNFSGEIEKWDIDDVSLELNSQWNIAKASGLSITHIDSHHNIHFNKIVSIPMSKLAILEDIPMRNTETPVDHTYPKTTDYFIGETYFHENGLNKIINILKSLEPGLTEINCHPGYVDKDLVKISPWTKQREKELLIFTNSLIQEYIQNLDINLVNFDFLRN